MSKYVELSIVPPETAAQISELITALTSAFDMLINSAKLTINVSKLNASGANLLLKGLEKSIEKIIEEIDELAGGSLSGIIAHPYAYRIRAGYDRITDTMTLTPSSALLQVMEAFDDEGDILAPVENTNYGGLVIVGSAIEIDNFAKILQALGKFFSQQDLIDLAKQIIERWLNSEVKEKLSTGIDFFGTTQTELVVELGLFTNVIKSYAESIKSGIVSTSGSLDDMIDFLDKKLEEGISIAEQSKDFINKFRFEISDSGVSYKIFKRSENTPKTIKKELLNGVRDSGVRTSYSIVLGLFASTDAIDTLISILSLD